MLSGEKLLGDSACFLRIGLISDVVAVEDASSTVASDLHNYRFCDSRPAQIPHGCASQIVKQQTGDAGSLTSEIPALAEVPIGLEPRANRMASRG